MKIEQRNIEEIKPFPGNPRINDKAIDAVAKSIQTFGWRNPIVIDQDSVVIAGHTRLKAAQRLGLTYVPVHVASDLTPEQIRAYRLADNKTAELSDWDYSLLPFELGELQNSDFDLSTLGFIGEELTRYLNDLDTDTDQTDNDPDADEVDTDSDPDEFPEIPTMPVSKPGEIYELGRHRILCGNNSSLADLSRLYGNDKIDLLFTSPPYAQQRDYGVASELISDWDALMSGAFSHLPMKDNGQILVNLGLVHRDREWQPYWRKWLEFMRQNEWLQFGLYIWDQLGGMPGEARGRLASCFELIFHFCRQPRGPNKIKKCVSVGKKVSQVGQRRKDGTLGRMSGAGDPIQPYRIPDAIISVARHNIPSKISGYDHPAPFNWRLAAEIINAYTDPGDTVLDQFCGSGSTIIAAERTDRRGFGVEIEPAYVDIIRKRCAWLIYGKHCNWEKLTPKIS